MKTFDEIHEEWMRRQEIERHRYAYEHRYDAANKRRQRAFDELERMEKREEERKARTEERQFVAHWVRWIFVWAMCFIAAFNIRRGETWNWIVMASPVLLSFADMIRWFERKEDNREQERDNEIWAKRAKFQETTHWSIGTRNGARTKTAITFTITAIQPEEVARQ